MVIVAACHFLVTDFTIREAERDFLPRYSRFLAVARVERAIARQG
jgi:hypothetical protein